MHQEKFEIEILRQFSILAEKLKWNIDKRVKKEKINIAENNDPRSVEMLLCLALIDQTNEVTTKINRMMREIEQKPESGLTPTYLKRVRPDNNNPKSI